MINVPSGRHSRNGGLSCAGFGLPLIVGVVLVYYTVMIPNHTLDAFVPSATLDPGTAAVRSTPAATSAPEPTSTIAYQATVQSALWVAGTAQSAADSANRMLVEATAQRQHDLFIQQGWTATADEWNRQAVMATARAQPTFVPATQTQQVFFAFALSTQQGIAMTSQSMTQMAPTQMVAIADAQADADTAQIRAWVVIAAILSISFLAVVMGLLLIHIIRQDRPLSSPVNPVKTESVTGSGVDPEQNAIRNFGTVVTIRHPDPVDGQRVVVPCTMDQLTALAVGLIQGHKTLAFNQWIGKGQPFTRDTFPIIRNFLMENRLTVSARQGNLILTAEGESFFRSWLDQGRLPLRYEISPDDGDLSPENMHKHALHVRAAGGEVVG